jgi:hypothetical protein
LLEKAIQQKIEKDLKGLGFGWKPLFFKKPDDGVIFALSRFGSHFAEMKVNRSSI